MAQLMDLSIIIPCYNEEESLPILFNKLNQVLPELARKYELELIFIDDGSADKTNQLLKEYAKSRPYVKIYKHEVNSGLARAHRTGFDKAKGNMVAVLDSDCTFDPIKLPQLISYLNEDTDIVTVSPYHPQGGYKNLTWMRLFLSRTLSRIYGFIIKADIYTYSNMCRVYRKKVVKDIKIETDRFISTSEILMKAILKGYKVKEFPDILEARKAGASKLKVIKTIFGHLSFILKLIIKKKKWSIEVEPRYK